MNTISELIEDIRQGKMVILVDHPERENEGDLIIPAEILTHDHMRMLIRHTSGIRSARGGPSSGARRFSVRP